MMTFIGTFGASSDLGKYYQPIKAGTAEQASKIMLEKHGMEWSTIYTVDEYVQLQNKGHFSGHKPLKWIGEGLEV